MNSGTAMVANCKKKNKSWFAVIIIFLVVEHVLAEKNYNNAVVMKIHENNGTIHVQPIVMINRHVLERKGKKIIRIIFIFSKDRCINFY